MDSIIGALVVVIAFVVAFGVAWRLSANMVNDFLPIERPLIGVLVSAVVGAITYTAGGCFPLVIAVFVGGVVGFLAESTRRDLSTLH